jgi:hypothetical protein
MRTSFHHQPEAQHPIFQLSTSWQADYPIFWVKLTYAGGRLRPLRSLMTHTGQKGGLKSRSAAVSWRIGSGAAQGRRRPSRFGTIQVCPKDCPSARWQADRAGIPGVYFDRRRFHHERADCTGSAGLGSRHRRNGALFGPSPPRHASVGICSGLKDQRATRLASG